MRRAGQLIGIVSVSMVLGVMAAADQGQSGAAAQGDKKDGQEVSETDIKAVQKVQKLLNSAVEGVKLEDMPLDDKQIKQLMDYMGKRDKAIAEGQVPDVKPVTVVRTLSLEPNAKQEEILVAPGYMTTVNFLDASGEPWEIEYAGAGNKEAYDVPKPAEGDHMVTVSMLQRYRPSNLVVRLKGLATPVTLNLKEGKEVVYSRFDARVPGFGPAGKPSIIRGAENPSAGDATLMGVLEGTMPEGAKRIYWKGEDRIVGWSKNGELYLRTPYPLQSPGWDSEVHSADGTAAYHLPTVASVVVVSKGGESTFVRADRLEE